MKDGALHWDVSVAVNFLLSNALHPCTLLLLLALYAAEELAAVLTVFQALILCLMAYELLSQLALEAWCYKRGWATADGSFIESTPLKQSSHTTQIGLDTLSDVEALPTFRAV
eukprot:4159-Heterococcus_DN1.PRE.1